MRRVTSTFAILVALLGLSLGGFAVAQDPGTPAAGGTPTDLLCATPEAGLDASPAATVAAPETAATPGGVAPGTPVGLVPCGTPSAATPGAEAAGSGAAAATTVTVEMADILFVQTELSIPANTDVTFHFVNNGAAVHNFLIDEPQVYSGDLQPGGMSDVTVNLPAGTYEYYCSVPGHRQAGMVGTLTVQ